MKIGFDISPLAYTGGVVTYTQNLSSRLQNLPGLEMVYFYSSLRVPYRGVLKNVKRFKIPISLTESFFNDWRVLPIERLIGKVDVYHSSDWIQPPTKAKKVTTYHDLIPIKYPEWSHPKIVHVHRRRLSLVEKEIDQVIAVSETTKQDLLELTKIPALKISVIYEGVDERFKIYPKEQVEEFRRRFNLPNRFILTIGGVGTRRNLERAKAASQDYPLIITGRTIERLDDHEMPLLYNCASLLLYPSLYEGFGLPILEAFACGVPVVTSNVSSMPEIAGPAALLVDPFEVEGMKKAVKQAMEDVGLRKGLVKLGLQRSKQFSWERCVQETVKLYRKLDAG